ncbi:MAG: hypothetical protein QXJ97_10650 [Desulfurococcaceae archaeon]
MRKVIKKHTYVPGKGEVNNLPSLTVPDQALPLKKLLSDYTRGVMPPNIRQPEYHGEEYVPDFQGMDLSELAEYAIELRERHRTLTDEHEKIKSRQEKEALRQQIIEELQQAENEELEQSSTTNP